MSRGVVLTLLCACVMAAIGRAEVRPCDPELAERGKFQITRVTLTDVSPAGAQLRDTIFSRAALLAAVERVESSLQVPADSQPRFRLKAVTGSCTWMDEAKKTAGVEIRADDLLIAEGDTASRVMDELDRGRGAEIARDDRIDVRFDHDDTMGNLVGVNYLFGDHQPENRTTNQWMRMGIGGWMDAQANYYHFGISWEQTSWNIAQPRTLHSAFVMAFWMDRIPLAGSTMLSKGARLGFGFEVQRGRLDVRMPFSYRFTETNVNSASGSLSHQGEHSGEASEHAERLTNGGFVRFVGWQDFGKAGQADGVFGRAGAWGRYYSDLRVSAHQSFLVDVLGSAGASAGHVPYYRRFAGGNRYDQPLVDRFYPTDEFTWAGPLYRAAGISSFVGPDKGPITAEVGGGSFWGASFTLGFPLYSQPFMRSVDARQKEQVQTLIQREFDRSVAHIMDAGLQSGLSPEKAERRAEKEGKELGSSLRNLIRHARRLSVRPVLVADAVKVTGGNALERTGVAAGYGLRVHGLQKGIEVLYMRTVHDSLKLPERPDNLIVRAYFRPGK